MYQHHNWQGALLDYPVSKVVCVGSNYAKHIKEMGSAAELFSIAPNDEITCVDNFMWCAFIYLGVFLHHFSPCDTLY